MGASSRGGRRNTRMMSALLHVALLLSLAVAVGCVPLQPPPPLADQVQAREVFGEHVPLITLMLWHAPELALTPEQVRALETLRGDFQRTADLQGAELQRAELELHGVLSRQEVDLARVETTLRRIEAIRTELRLGRIKTVEKGKATLTPEQRQKLQPLIRGGP